MTIFPMIWCLVWCPLPSCEPRVRREICAAKVAGQPRACGGSIDARPIPATHLPTGRVEPDRDHLCRLKTSEEGNWHDWEVWIKDALEFGKH